MKNNIFDINKGLDVLKKSLITCPNGPGVYQFTNNLKIIYIGKAKNLNKRVSSYSNFNSLTNRLKKMVSSITSIKLIKTHTEVDALLLESNLIKKYKPVYNIRLIDDKSFPYISISQNQDWPRLQKYRGQKDPKKYYFGPFANVNMVEEVLTILERGFLIRTCSDTVFKTRKRPCLLYQIKRCSAPCVGYIDSSRYNNLVNQAIEFLNGKDEKIRNDLILKMQIESKEENYEQAAICRDRLKALSKINQKQYINVRSTQDFDLICSTKKYGIIFIQIFFFRKGKNLGNRDFNFDNCVDQSCEEILEKFIPLFYLNHFAPKQIIVDKKVDGIELIKNAISKDKGLNILIENPKRGEKFELLKIVQSNLKHTIDSFIQTKKTNHDLLIDMQQKLSLSNLPKKIEVFDNSHLGGNQPVGGMIVYEDYKFNRDKYRKFNIKSDLVKLFDDYYMMKQVLNRRLSIVKNEDFWKKDLPDLIIIDGGRGHHNVCYEILKEKKMLHIDIISIAKGEKRNAGNETIYNSKGKINLINNDKVLFFLQRLRDEAHRFSVSAQRYRRTISMKNSIFDEITGIGKNSKKSLLSHFGSIDNIKTAGIKDLEKVQGIGKVMAKKIYDEFN